MWVNIFSDENILKVFTSEWQSRNQLLLKFNLENNMDGRFLYVKLKSLVRRGIAEEEIINGTKMWKLPKQLTIPEIQEEIVEFRGIKLVKSEIIAIKNIEETLNITLEPSSKRYLSDGFVVESNHIIDLGLIFKDSEIIPDSLGDLKYIEILTLEGESIRTLPNSIENLKKLHTLNFHTEKSTKLPENISKLVKLERIYLTGEISKVVVRGFKPDAKTRKIRDLLLCKPVQLVIP